MTGFTCLNVGLFGSQVAYTAPSGLYGDLTSSPTDAGITFFIYASGVYQVVRDNGPDPSSDWVTPQPPATHYVRVTPTSGTFSSGSATGTWLTISGQSWRVVYTLGSGAKTCTFDVEIATDSGGTNIVAAGSMTLEAAVDV